MWIPARSHHSLQSSSYDRKIEKKFGQQWFRWNATYWSKAFDCLRHDLVTAQLVAYGFGQPSICFIFSYLSGRTQRTKMNNVYSSYTNIKYGVPQCSIFNTLLFNLDIGEILWEYKYDIAIYADDNTPYTSDISLNLVLEKLERSTQDFFRWFKENHMKANSGKCHLLQTTNSLTSLNTNGFQITNSNKITRY